MSVHKVKSRMQTYGRPRAGNVVDIQQIAVAFGFPNFEPNEVTQGAKSVKKPDMPRKSYQRQPAFTLGGSSSDSSEEAVYEDTDHESEPEQLVIMKQSVPSVEEQKRKGLLTSALGDAIPPRPSPARPSIPDMEDVSAEDPSASLILGTPVYMPHGDGLQEVQPSSAQQDGDQAWSNPKANPASRSLLGTLVALFAGRKKPVQFKPNKSRPNTEPVFDTSRYGAESEDEAQAASDRTSYTRAEPHLTLPQVIPDHRNRGNGLVRRENAQVLPPLFDHRLAVSAFVQPDKFTPDKTTRGFNASEDGAPNTSTTETPLAPLAYRAHKQGNSAAMLLDRDDKTWAGWHDKNPVPSKMPFAKQPSSANLNGAEAETNDFANGGHSGPCYLKHTGDAYPYAQGKCW
ncbi:hypothetical protein NX059_007293 [Plenodomus lindquistii]|nr:hypothetical protein NX059_007293 [Plenodomus lindquistii]